MGYSRRVGALNDVRALLELTAAIAADYVESLEDRPVFPDVTPEQLREALGGPLPEQPTDTRKVLTELAAGADPGLVAMGSGRYFGFVIGGALPAALAADWLASAWDQNAGLYVGGPSARRRRGRGGRRGRRAAARRAVGPWRRWWSNARRGVRPLAAAARRRLCPLCLECGRADPGEEGRTDLNRLGTLAHGKSYWTLHVPPTLIPDRTSYTTNRMF